MSTNMKKVGAAVLLLSTAACTTLQPVADPDAFLAKKNPSFIVVTTAEHSEREDALVFHGPTIESGTLTGMVLNESTSMPVTQVRTIMAPQLDKRKTTWAIVIGGVVATGLGLIIANSGDGAASNYYNPSCGHQSSCYIPMSPARASGLSK